MSKRTEKPMGPITEMVFLAAYDLLDTAKGRSVSGGQIAKRVGEPIHIVAPVLAHLERHGLLNGPVNRAARRAARDRS